MFSVLHATARSVIAKEMLKTPGIRSFTEFRTALPKKMRNGTNHHSEKNLKKEFIKKKGGSHSSTIWLDRQLRDPYTIRAKEEGYRSRAIYKIQEINEKYHIIQDGSIVLDVGAAPGGWSQYAVSQTGVTVPCSVLSIDLLPIKPIEGVHCIQGDFMEDAMKRKLAQYLGDRKADVVISDIAPNFSGDHSIDHEVQIDMCRSVVQFAKEVAVPSCSLVLKVIQGAEFQKFMQEQKKQFKTVLLMKPKASHKQSSEVYCILRQFI